MSMTPCHFWIPDAAEVDGWAPYFAALYRDATPEEVTAARIEYAGDDLAKADQPNERWITLHPHGSHEGHGVPVKIRVQPDGTAHVLSGPGELRGLRLTRLASPEQLAERRAKRDEARKVKRKQDKEDRVQKEREDLYASAQDPEHAQKVAQAKVADQEASEKRVQGMNDLDARMRELHGKMLEHAARLTGDEGYLTQAAQAAGDPGKYAAYKQKLQGDVMHVQPAAGEEEAGITEDEAKYAGAVIASRNVRQVNSALKALGRDLVHKLVGDRSLREAVLGEEGEVQLPDDAPPAGLGYTTKYAARAEEQGYTPEDAREEAESAFDDRIERIHKDSPERAAAIVAISERVKGNVRATARAQQAKREDGSALREAKPAREAPREAVQEHAQHVREFLKLQQELEALEREKRALSLGKDPEATPAEGESLAAFDKPLPAGAEVDADVNQVTPEFAAKLNQQIQDAAKADVTRSFLDSLEDAAGGQGTADRLIRDRMQGHIGAGAHAHLSNVALAALGHEGVDRMVVDVLGIDAASQLIAHAVRTQAEDPDAVRAGLAGYHDETSVPRMQEAVEFAQAARADAAQLELPAVTSATDMAAVKDLQKRRRAAIAGAHEALGTALGTVEAGAALNLALKGPGRDTLRIRLGDAPTAQVATRLRALGLQDGDYALDRSEEDNTLGVTLTKSGMDRLTLTRGAEEQARSQAARSIKSGAQDEPDYLPRGFMARSEHALNRDPGVPTSFQQEADFTRGPDQAVQDVAASMYADGYKPSEILTHLLDTVSQHCPDGQRAAFSQAVTRLIPFAKTEQKLAKDGTTVTVHRAVDVDHDPEVRRALAGHARAWLDANHPGDPDFHSQRVEDDAHTREALFQAVAAEPALQAAFSPPGDLGGSAEGRERARAVQGYFYRKVLGIANPREYDEQARAAQKAALEKLGPAPEKWGAQQGGMFDMFAGAGGDPDAGTVLRLSPHATPEQHVGALAAYGLRPEHYTLNGEAATLTDAGRAVLRIPHQAPTVDGTPDSPQIISGGLDGLNPEWVRYQREVAGVSAQHPTLSDRWESYKGMVGGGTKRALESVQEVMQGDLLTRFAEHHARLTGQQLRVSKETTRHWEKRLAATDPDEAKRIRARDRAVMDGVRTRDGSGRYLNMGEGGLAGAVQNHLEAQARQRMLQGSLFGLDTGKGGGEVTGRRVHDLDVGPHERLSLGHSAEMQVAGLLRGTRWGVKPTDASFSTLKNLTWGKGTEHVTKQRAVKLLLQTGRLAGWLGAGTGKTGTMLGAYTEARAQGKARKALYVVPSIVRNQFGEAAASFTEPGRYTWHAEDAPYSERKGHYSGPTDMVVVTHQTFRDDMIKLLAEHKGMAPDEAGEWFAGQGRAERAQAFRAMLDHHGIPLDMVHVDEAHDFLNRQGKQDSGMSKVLEAALDNAPYKAVWTGSPVKNDASEIHDWLSKLDPSRFGDRDEFMRRYGVNTKASAEALQRLVDEYSVIDAVRPDIQRKIVWGKDEGGQHAPIRLTPQQQEAYQAVHDAFERASSSVKAGQVDVDAMRVLSPNSFAGRPEAEHREIAARLGGALGTLKHGALGRVINEFPAEHNAKVQHVAHLARQNRGQGGVVFARNKASVRMLRDELTRQGLRVGVIDGSATTDEKGKVRNSFDNGNVDVVVCSDAAATGANLQKRGKWLVNYDLPMTYKTMEQRNARIDRLGQRDGIELHHLVTDTPYDRDQVKRLDEKRELGSILQGEWRDMEDTGVAAFIRRARAERDGDGPEGWEEPLGHAAD